MIPGSELISGSIAVDANGEELKLSSKKNVGTDFSMYTIAFFTDEQSTVEAFQSFQY